MPERIDGPKSWLDTFLYPYYWMKGFLFQDKLEKEIGEKLDTASKTNQWNIPGTNNFDVKVTGSCTVVIPGRRPLCRNDITKEVCDETILQAQQQNPAIHGWHREGGRCVG